MYTTCKYTFGLEKKSDNSREKFHVEEKNYIKQNFFDCLEMTAVFENFDVACRILVEFVGRSLWEILSFVR
jgi:hypothetical protein